MPCGAVLCLAVPCCALLCRALLCILFRTYQRTTLASVQSWREPACPRAFYAAVLSLHFHFCSGIFFYAVPVYSNNSSAIVCTSTLSLSTRTASTAQHSPAQHSTAQHGAITPAQRCKSSTRRSEYVPKEVCTYMHAASVFFPGTWSSWHLQVACSHLKCWTIYLLHMSVIPIHSSL